MVIVEYLLNCPFKDSFQGHQNSGPDWNDKEQADVMAVIRLLETLGTRLGYPYSSKIIGAKLAHLRELRIQHKGKPYRILYAFDPQREAILLIGGN